MSRRIRRTGAAPLTRTAATSYARPVADDAPPPAPNPDELRARLEALQKSAMSFVKKVRASGAIEQMTDAAADLGSFDGATAAAKAQQAADTLKKFIGECKGMGDAAKGLCPLTFKPKICDSMGKTIDELLGAEGLSPGGGTGASGGFSERRSSLRNTGLYGRIPRKQAGGARAGRSALGGNTPGETSSNPPGQAGATAPGGMQASGESDVAVPPQYKRKVGEYFQRVADELGQE